MCSGSAEVLPANMAASSTSFAEPLMGAAMYMPFNSSPFDTHNFTEHCNQNEMVSNPACFTCMPAQCVQAADLLTFNLNI